jgi:hypothetical protein
MFHLIVCKDDPHIKMWTHSKFKNESGRILALKKLPQHPVKDKDEEAPPKYFKKKVPLWNCLQNLFDYVTKYFKKKVPLWNYQQNLFYLIMLQNGWHI